MRDASARDELIATIGPARFYGAGPIAMMLTRRWGKPTVLRGWARGEGENDLGWMYYKGLGVPQDKKMAIEWYQKAAAQGDKNAKANLANLQ